MCCSWHGFWEGSGVSSKILVSSGKFLRGLVKGSKKGCGQRKLNQISRKSGFCTVISSVLCHQTPAYLHQAGPARQWWRAECNEGPFVKVRFPNKQQGVTAGCELKVS